MVRKVGVVGLGVIGGAVVQALAGGIDGLMLSGVCVRDAGRASERLARLGVDAALHDLGDLVSCSDIVVDAAVAGSLPEIGRAVLGAGRVLLTMNSGALLDAPDLFALAGQNGGSIVVPSGGVAGFDGIRAACLSGVESLTLISRKRPESLAGAPYVVAQGLDLDGLTAPLRIFSGNAREAARAFPANANVAASLSLAGPGPECTKVEIWADPDVRRITQQIHLVTQAAELNVTIESDAMPDNPRTGSLTPLSAIAALRGLGGSVRIGS